MEKKIEKTLNFLNNIKKHAERLARFPTCENCGRILKLEINPVDAVLMQEKSIIIENKKWYIGKENGVSYGCGCCASKAIQV